MRAKITRWRQSRFRFVTSRQAAVEQLGGMKRMPAREMLDLEPAGESRRDDDSTGSSLSHGRQQSLLAHQPRDLVMLALVAERAGHAAAAGVEVDHLRPGNPVAAVGASAPCPRATLVAVRLHEDLGRAGLPAERRPVFARQSPIQKLLERLACPRDGLGPGTQLALEQGGIIVPDRQDAARLAGDDRPALLRPIEEALDVVPGVAPRPGRAGRWRSAAGRSSAGRPAPG